MTILLVVSRAKEKGRPKPERPVRDHALGLFLDRLQQPRQRLLGVFGNDQALLFGAALLALLGYRWRCKGCAKTKGANAMFTVRTGTIFEETRLPLRVWVTAFWKACANKKGISALQLSREMEITHKSALFVLRRIRHGLGYNEKADGKKLLTGTVEVDGTYVGGKPRYTGNNGTGRGTFNKVPVVAMV